jgi:aspartyl-tRNA(Asn)/glutamyl-tRNA(Gln) amidotransferase subunit C
MLTRETVEKVSHLARLKLTEEELRAFSEQLSAVLKNFEQIAKIDTQDVLPLVTPTDMSVHLRQDVVEPTDGEKMLSNAPDKVGRLFKVPPVV